MASRIRRRGASCSPTPHSRSQRWEAAHRLCGIEAGSGGPARFASAAEQLPEGLIRPTAKETCFWQWGSASDFKSYLVGCPAEKTGVVILTNSSRGRIIARRIAVKALGE